MAKQKPSTDEVVQIFLTTPKEIFIKDLDERIEIGKEIFDRKVNSLQAMNKIREDFSFWNDYNIEYLKQAFNNEYNEYKKNYVATGKARYTVLTDSKSDAQKLIEFKERVRSKINYLLKLKAKTNLIKTNNFDNINNVDKSLKMNTKDVFIVHGHDEEAKIKTARFIEKLDLKPIILHEQASGSKTVIEKIEAYSNVGFGIVLYTPCDIGAKKEDSPNIKNRARQNVVFEHGFLIGKIGRENVCALVKGDIETPNDISGVVYVKMDEDEAWQMKILRELRNSGYEIDANKL